jgi:hypothetical protein
MLSPVLYEFEIWSLALEEDHRLRMFENGMLRNLFGLKRKLTTEYCRITHDKELRDIYPSLHILTMINSRGMRWAGSVAHLGDKRIAHKGSDGET